MDERDSEQDLVAREDALRDEGTRPRASAIPITLARSSADSELPETLTAQRVTIRHELFDAVFTSRGGGLESFVLNDYTDRTTPGEPQVDIVTLGEESDLALATPLAGPRSR